jgi:FixJ family two-component response regulator
VLCSMQLAYDPTETARKQIEAERDAAIAAAKAKGKSNRAIARETGIPSRTVDRAASGPKVQPAQMAHPETAAPKPMGEPW